MTLVLVGARGWFGRTLVHEFLSRNGLHAAGQLRLFGSADSTLTLSGDLQDVELPVRSLSSLTVEDLEGCRALFWYAFVLRNKLERVGLSDYRRINDAIADRILAVLAERPDVPCVFTSSGVARGQPSQRTYEEDPYSFLKREYEQRLRAGSQACVVYPYAMTGTYLADWRNFALGSFIHQALTNGRIRIQSRVPVVRSLGNVGDLSRYLLTVVEGASLPTSITPVSHTLTLGQLAFEVCAALGIEPIVEWEPDRNGDPLVYVSDDHRFCAQLASVGMASTVLADQIRETADGPAFEQWGSA